MWKSTTRLRRKASTIIPANLKFLILREGQSGLKQFEISARKVFWSVIGLAVLTPIVFFLGSQLLLETAHSYRVAKLRKDNQALQQLVTQFENRIETLQLEVTHLTEMDQNLRKHANLPDIPAGIREVGIGGSMAEVMTDMDYLLPLTDISLAQVTERLDALSRSTRLEQISYQKIKDSLKNDVARLRAVPSTKPVTGGTYSSGYGYRRHPYSKRHEFHSGLDIKLRPGTAVHSTADGKVIAARYDRNLGLYVKIDHGNGCHSIYGHLRRIVVSSGQRVMRGDKIAESGNTGRSTAPHLHYEVRLYNQPQNPSNYF